MDAAPGVHPVSLEQPHDLLWLAPAPRFDHDPRDRAEPDRPRADFVPLAAAEVAQLVAFGATPPPRCGSWQALVDGVIADAAVTEASVGAFPIPTVVSTVDKQVVPGTELVVELGYLGGAGIHRGARLPGDRPGGRARPVAACGRRCRGSRCPGGVVPRRIAERGLLVPAALLDRGGWPALWQRAHR